MSETDRYTYETYRVEWLTEVYPVDQYGHAMDGPPYYVAKHPTREAAQADLERIAKPHEFVQGRWVSDLCNHSYHECGVRPVKVLVTPAPDS